MKIKKRRKIKSFFYLGIMSLGSFCWIDYNDRAMAQANDNGSSHIGLFNEETTFSISSETGVLPNIEIRTKDIYGNEKIYKNESGEVVISKTENKEIVKNVILKGRTLENLIYQYNNVNGEVRADIGSKVFESNKKYMIKVHNPTDFIITNRQVIVKGHGYQYSYFNEETPYMHTSARAYNQVLVSLKDSENNSPSLTELTDVKIIAVDYQEGMEHWKIPYFEGKKSVEMPVLTLSNKDNSQSVTISLEENVLLRSNGEVYDELDLMTGKFIQRIGEDGEILSTPKTRVLKIKGDSIFESIKESEVNMVGTIDATIASVTLPTEPLSFRINPNLPIDQQFVASGFSISNNSQSPLTIELKEFVQTTDVFEDVGPDYYEEWKDLTQEESKKIALGLVPKASDNWLTLNEGTYYVSETKEVILGRIRSQSTIDFEFSALHGQAFGELPNPQYRLTFIFGF